MPTVTITPQECRTLSQYIHELCGITLDQSKAYLFESRLQPLLVACQCQTYDELYRKARQEPQQQISQQIIDAISTHETSFFRDTAPFELLTGTLLPALLAQTPVPAPGTVPQLTIWSAACATGQEVYSLAMTLQEAPLDLRRYRIRILGTDISAAALAQASAGLYNKVEMARGLSPARIARYFEPTGSSWRVKEELRSLVNFRQLNLLGALHHLGAFDIIFCRNVAIYFNQQDRLRLFQRLADHLRPTGALVLGATESLQGLSERYVRRLAQRVPYYQLLTTAAGIQEQTRPYGAT
ncbi:MAG: protein-glutamate O-methyltransferase CheR [Candidatus Tectimicrobiota bacterium]